MALQAPRRRSKNAKAIDSPSENENTPGAAAPRKRRIRLNNAKDVRRELANVYRSHVNGEMDVVTARGRAAILYMLRASIETDEIERKLDLLEQQAGGDL